MDLLDPQKESIRELKVDAMLRLSFRGFWNILPRALVIAIIAGIVPSFAAIWAIWTILPERISIFRYGYYLPHKTPEPYVQDCLTVFIVGAFILLAHGGVVASAMQWRRNGRVSIGASLVLALKRWPLILFTAMLIALIVSGILQIMRWPENTLLFILFGVTGLTWQCILLAMFSLFVPVCIEERAGLFGGLTRSRSLTRGDRSTAFLLMLVFLAATVAFCWSISLAGSIADVIWYSFYRSGEPPDFFTLLVWRWMAFLWEWRTVWTLTYAALGAIAWSVTVAVLYCSLRELKEEWQPA